MLPTLQKGAGQIRLPQFLLQQHQMGSTFSLFSSPPDLWAWLKNCLFSDVSLPFDCKIQKNVKKKKTSAKYKGEGSTMALNCHFCSLTGEEIKAKELPGLYFGHVVADGPTSHPCCVPPMTWVMSPVPTTPSSKNKRCFIPKLQLQHTTAAGSTQNHPHFFPGWIFFSRLLSYLEGAFRFLKT